MPPLKEHITGFVAGDKLDVRKGVSNIQPGRTLIKAWMTIKNVATDLDPGVMQKVITTVAVGGVGQITDNGADMVGEVLFQFTMADTTLLGPDKAYVYDIQLKYDNAEIATLQYGEIIFIRGVTDAAT